MKNKAEFSIMDKSNRRFRDLHLILDLITSIDTIDYVNGIGN